MEKTEVLANYLGCEEEDIQETSYCFEYGREEYLVLDDTEADEKAKEYIEDSLWAFRPEFLAGETGIDQTVFDTFVKADLCENANDAIKSIIDSTCGIDSFVESAISADGRGQFLSSYDGEEVEHEDYYIYRVN
jgi:hypothetical protein